MITSIQPDRLEAQRDILRQEVFTNPDWAYLNGKGALPEHLEFDLSHEQINEDILVDAGSINVFIKHKTTQRYSTIVI